METENKTLTSHLIRYTARFGTLLLLFLLIWGCAAVPRLEEGTGGTYLRLPFVRVLIDNGKSTMSITAPGQFSVECLRGGKSYVYYASRSVTIRADAGRVSVATSSGKIGDRFDEVLLTPRSDKQHLSYIGHRYRGVFRVIPHNRNLRLINVVHMDDYLKGVVPPEIGFTKEAELEAIKAQAVAARTYSMSHLSQYIDEPYDLKSDVSDQVYHGVEVENAVVSRAVEATRGYVLKYRDELINAYYHSTCGGYTDDVDEVWDKKSTPYLRAVPDSGFCSWSKYYTWKESYSVKQLKLRLEEYLSSERGRVVRLGKIVDMNIVGRTAGGRVARMKIETSDGSYTVGSDKIRWVFTRSSNPELILQSARFDLKKTYDGSRRLTRVDFIGGGYGHGVGMCQCGAIGMARAGRAYEQILKHYYRNVDLVKLY